MVDGQVLAWSAYGDITAWMETNDNLQPLAGGYLCLYIVVYRLNDTIMCIINLIFNIFYFMVIHKKVYLYTANFDIPVVLNKVTGNGKNIWNRS